MKKVVDVAPEGVFAIALKREDRPQFKRIYTAGLPNGRKVKIELYTSMFGKRESSYGEITQPNGRWVLFEIERVADKVLDPVLVPLVESLCRQALALDRQFMESNPSEFIDEGGTHWVRN